MQRHAFFVVEDILMKRQTKIVIDYYEGINGILLFLYISLVLSAYAIAVNDSVVAILRQIVFSLIFSAVAVPLAFRAVKKLTENRLESGQIEQISDITLKIVFYLIPFLFFLFRFINCYPGIFSYDSIVQYTQAIDNEYNDWHPVIHTLIAYKLPLTLTGGWFGSIILEQIILLALSMGYSLSSIMKHTNKTTAFVVFLFYLLNPKLGNISVYAWKDVTFTTFTLLTVTYCFNVFFSKGEWLKKPFNTAVFIPVFVITTMIRHNAVLFTFPLMFAIVFYVEKKRFVFIFLSSLLLIGVVKYPLYSALGVTAPGNRQIETLGLPMSVIGEVVAHDPASLDDYTKEFAYKIAAPEVWEKTYVNGFNSVKYKETSNNDVIEEYGRAEVFRIMFRCVKASPLYAMKGFITVTCPAYSITGNELPGILDSDYGEYGEGNLNSFEMINRQYSRFCAVVVPFLFFFLGCIHLAILTVFFAKYRLNTLEGWKRALFVLPLFINNFGTMFLMTSNYDYIRISFYSFMTAPLLLILLLKNGKSKNVEQI